MGDGLKAAQPCNEQSLAAIEAPSGGEWFATSMASSTSILHPIVVRIMASAAAPAWWRVEVGAVDAATQGLPP